MNTQAMGRTNSCKDIPLPIVKLNRWTIVVGVVAGVILQQPLFTTLLFLILLPAVLVGQRASLIFQIGTRIFAKQNQTAEREDRQLMRFNNSIALILLTLAQVAFLAGVPVLGWTFAAIVAIAASVALAGFCVGCFMYFQFKMNRARLLKR